VWALTTEFWFGAAAFVFITVVHQKQLSGNPGQPSPCGRSDVPGKKNKYT
jgi:hypothetical protein